MAKAHDSDEDFEKLRKLRETGYLGPVARDENGDPTTDEGWRKSNGTDSATGRTKRDGPMGWRR